jgi:hypothetical protein
MLRAVRTLNLARFYYRAILFDLTNISDGINNSKLFASPKLIWLWTAALHYHTTIYLQLKLFYTNTHTHTHTHIINCILHK